jgi:LCP family protein required for cell wall assembly
MRTTLKRGYGRAAAANGNGRAVLPPAIAPPMTRYEQPRLPRRRGLSLIAVLVGAVYGAALVALLEKAVEAHSIRSSPFLKVAAAGVAALAIVMLLTLLLAWSERRRATTSTFWQRAAMIAFGLCIGASIVDVGSAGGAYLFYHESIGSIAAHSRDVKLASKHLKIPLPNEPAIALIVGYDRRKGKDAALGQASRSDTVMLLRSDPVSESVSMLSFPRDLTTDIWCGNKIVGHDRINTAYTLCDGARGTLDTVTHLTGLPINYLITVDFHGFKKVVDSVGGVWVDVDRRYYNKNVGTNYTNYANINLKPGYQRLNGGQALDYVRFRHTDSDIFRLARQQQFVKALKQQVSQNFSAFTMLKVIGAITHSVEIGQASGAGSLENAIRGEALFAYKLPSGHFFQSKIEGLQGTNELYAPPSAIQTAVDEFQNPDVQAAQKATAVSFGRKAAGLTAPPPSTVTVNVLNGNGVLGSATNAGFELHQHGYTLIVPPNPEDRNAPTFDYFKTKVYYDRTQAHAKAAAFKLADLFGDADVAKLPVELVPRAAGAMVTVVVGSTFKGTIAPAPVDRTPKKEPPNIRTDPAQSSALLRSVRKRVPFRLLVPTVVESNSYIDREVPLRVYAIRKHERAVRLTFLDHSELAGYWGIEETAWDDAPVLQQPNFKHTIKGRDYEFYFNGPHLHMVVLRDHGASYWVVNTLTDSLSNETMIAIAKGLKPLKRSR